MKIWKPFSCTCAMIASNIKSLINYAPDGIIFVEFKLYQTSLTFLIASQWSPLWQMKPYSPDRLLVSFSF